MYNASDMIGPSMTVYLQECKSPIVLPVEQSIDTALSLAVCLSIYTNMLYCCLLCAVDVQCIGHDRAEYDNLPAGVQVSNHAASGAVHRHCTLLAAYGSNDRAVLSPACVGRRPLLPGRISQPWRWWAYADVLLHTSQVRRVAWFYFQFSSVAECLPSLLWHCWLGGRKGIWSIKNWVVGCWHGCLSGAQCRFAYGPADATATHCLLLH